VWQINSVWDVITALCTAIIAAGVFLAFWQLKEARNATRIEALNTLLEMWGNVEQREARRFVFRDFKFNGLNNLTDEERKRIETVLASCNRISYLTLNRLVPEEDVLRLVGRPMIRVWDRLKPFIDARREEVGEQIDKEDPYRYMTWFEEFAKKYKTKLRPKSN